MTMQHLRDEIEQRILRLHEAINRERDFHHRFELIKALRRAERDIAELRFASP